MTVETPHNEWNELDAAQRSEADYGALMRGQGFSWSTRDLDAARKDAMRAMAVGVPDPRDMAALLETSDFGAAETLRKAWIGKSQPYAGSWRVEENGHTAVLRSLGLVGWAGPNDGCAVGAFGNQVRKIMLLELDEGDN